MPCSGLQSGDAEKVAWRELKARLKVCREKCHAARDMVYLDSHGGVT